MHGKSNLNAVNNVELHLFHVSVGRVSASTFIYFYYYLFSSIYLSEIKPK